jgi:uncharacterized protein
MKKIKLKITGIHCKSCKELIESEINLLNGIEKVDVCVKNDIARVIYNEKHISSIEIINEIKSLNYGVKKIESEEIYKSQINSIENKFKSSNLLLGGILLFLIAIIYYVVSSYGGFELLARLNESNLSFPLIFVIGLLASFHCIGMCGGIVMAYTTRFCASVKGNKSINISHLSYNAGRILAYAVVGFILGGLGSFFAISRSFTGIVTLLAGVFMIMVGASLSIRLAILDKITGILPVSIVRLFSSKLHSSRPRAPFIIGFLNGFMPCGPLQALQIYSLTTGSALRGGLSMAAFGLGTVPLMLGFGNIISIFSQSRLKQVMKVSGVIVILLGLLTLGRGWNSFGFEEIAQPTPQTSVNPAPTQNTQDQASIQTVSMSVTPQGYSPNTLTVKKGVPVKWVIDGNGITGCTSEILLPAFGIDRPLKRGENIIEFTPKVAGTYKFSCGMQMVWGKFIVTS